MLRIDKDNFQLHFEAIAFGENGVGYAASAEFNGLFKVNVQNGECTYISVFPNEALDGKRLYFAAAYSRGKVVFAPHEADNIAIYDIASNLLEILPFDMNESIKFNRNVKFADILAFDGNFFLIGATYPFIVKLNAETKQLKYIPMDIDEPFLFRKATCVQGDLAFIPSGNSNLVLEFNMRTESVQRYKLPCDFRGTWSMCSVGKAFWLIPRYKGTGFVRWDKDTNMVVELNDFPEGFKGDNNALFLKAYYLNGYVWAIPELSNMVLKVDVEGLKILKEDKILLGNDEKMGYYFEKNEELYLIRKARKEPFANQIENHFFKVNMNTLECVPYCFLFKDGYDRFVYDRMIVKAPGMRESVEVSLDNFLYFISHNPEECN